MSKDPANPLSSRLHPFDVFRSDGSTRLPGQRFAPGERPESNRRSGPAAQRVISDASADLSPRSPLRDARLLGDSAPEADQASPGTGPDPVAIRLQTFSIDLAGRIASVKAGQQEAMDHLQQLEDGSGALETRPDPRDNDDTVA